MLSKKSERCAGIYHYETEIQPKHTGVVKMQEGEIVTEFSDQDVNARVLVESQAMTMRFVYF